MTLQHLLNLHSPSHPCSTDHSPLFLKRVRGQTDKFKVVLLRFLFAFSYKASKAFHHFSTGNYILDCLSEWRQTVSLLLTKYTFDFFKIMITAQMLVSFSLLHPNCSLIAHVAESLGPKTSLNCSRTRSLVNSRLSRSSACAAFLTNTTQFRVHSHRAWWNRGGAGSWSCPGTRREAEEGRADGSWGDASPSPEPAPGPTPGNAGPQARPRGTGTCPLVPQHRVLLECWAAFTENRERKKPFFFQEIFHKLVGWIKAYEVSQFFALQQTKEDFERDAH